MNKKTKLALLIGVIAAVVSAVVVVIVFWDKLLALCPCKEKAGDAECCAEDAPDDGPAFSEDERQAFADLEPKAE